MPALAEPRVPTKEERDATAEGRRQADRRVRSSGATGPASPAAGRVRRPVDAQRRQRDQRACRPSPPPHHRDGKRTTPVVWDSGCLEEVCGACTMLINGRVRQSCSCLIDEYAPNDGDVITLEPMSKFPVIRDLWVDRERLFHNLKRVKAWVPIDSTYSLGAGPRESPSDQQTRYKLSECMSCGCCLEACPQFNIEPDERQVGRELHRRPRDQPGPPLQRPRDRQAAQATTASTMGRPHGPQAARKSRSPSRLRQRARTA
jgi:ferredoxin